MCPIKVKKINKRTDKKLTTQSKMMHRKRKTSVEKVQVDNFQIFKHVESSDRAYKIV